MNRPNVYPRILFAAVTLFTVVFMLGMAKTIMSPLPLLPSTTSLLPQTIPLNTTLQATPVEDQLLTLKLPADLISWDDSIQVENLSHTYYQYISHLSESTIAKWYRNLWEQEQLLVFSSEHDRHIQLNTLDYKRRRFLMVSVKWRKTEGVSEILATSMQMPPKGKRIKRMSPNFTTTGKTVDGGQWKRVSAIRSGSIEDCKREVIDENTAEGWVHETSQDKQNAVFLGFSRPAQKEYRYYSLSAGKKPHTVNLQQFDIQEMDAHENS